MGGRTSGSGTAGDSGPDTGWITLDDCLAAAPPSLHGWLAEPGLLTARVQRAGGDLVRFTLLRLAPAPLERGLAVRMGVADTDALVREIEFACGDERWIFAQSVFPDSTLREHPWLGDLGGVALGVSLLGRHDVSREPLEYRRVEPDHPLAIAAGGLHAAAWARRAVYHLSGAPIIVQELFLPALAARPGP
ncbi:MAG: chorismate lyase [Steroidobacteraceae bacterium]